VDPLDLPVSSLGHLSTRVIWCLNNEHIKTVRDLAAKTERDMLRIPNFGKVSLGEVKQLLYQRGLSLTPDDTQEGTPPLPFPSMHERLNRIEQRLAAVERTLNDHMLHPLREVGDVTVHDMIETLRED
jgi:hypothetical protein